MKPLKDNIKTIFLDAGGVLFETFIKGDERIRNLMLARGYERSRIDKAIIKASKLNPTLITHWEEEGQWYKAYYGTIARELGNDKLVHELFYFAHYAHHCELFPEVKGVLNKLSQSYRLGIISNAMPSMDWIFDRLGIRQYFDPIILSAFVNVEKPDEAIYHLALNALHVEKAKSIFIDDKQENVEAATKVGMLGIHLDREKRDLLQLLKDYELL